MKPCLIKQPAGLGYIFFTQKIAKRLLERNTINFIIWPIVKEYSYLKEYISSSNIMYIDVNTEFPYKQYLDQTNIIDNDKLLYLPLQNADMHVYNEHIMQVKYKYVGLDYLDWKKYFNFNRNSNREAQLIQHLNINLDQPFNLINCNYGSINNKILRRDIKPNNGYINISMERLSFDNIFDWIGICEKAAEIHTVDTSLCYILEKMNFKNVTIYSRIPNTDFLNYTLDIFSKDWKRIP